jgi:hypothetical protein
MKRLQVDAPIVIGDIDLEPLPYINGTILLTKKKVIEILSVEHLMA